MEVARMGILFLFVIIEEDLKVLWLPIEELQELLKKT
jgi:hypothetical protein